MHHDRRRRKRRRHLHGRATHPARHHRRAERRLNRCSAHRADDHRGQRHPGHEAARRHHLRVLRRIHTHARASTCRRYLCAHTEGQGWGTDAEARALTDVCERLMLKNVQRACEDENRQLGEKKNVASWTVQAVSRAKILADFFTFSQKSARPLKTRETSGQSIVPRRTPRLDRALRPFRVRGVPPDPLRAPRARARLTESRGAHSRLFPTHVRVPSNCVSRATLEKSARKDQRFDLRRWPPRSYPPR